MINDDFLNKINENIKREIDTNYVIKEHVERSFEELGKKLKESFSPQPIYAAALLNAFDGLGRALKVFADGVLLFKLQQLGFIEWCNIDKWVDLKGKRNSKVFKTLSDKIYFEMTKDNFELMSIDRYIGKHFTREIITQIENETITCLDENDIEKLKMAMIDFRASRYLDSANILAGLIDSQSIKQELFDYDNKKYRDKFIDKDKKPNISQGWRSFYHVFANNFSVYFDGEEFDCGKKRDERFEEFIDKIKGKLPNDNEIVTSIVALSFCLFKYFEDTDWTCYPDFIPAVINRHWLMHGMYDIEDVTRNDCIKLLLMLNQISNLYSKLKCGTL